LATIDLEDPESWPEDVREVAEEFARELAGSTESASDLAIDLSMEGPFRALLTGHRLRAYHATRLFDVLRLRGY